MMPLKIQPIFPEPDRLIEMGARIAMTIVVAMAIQWILSRVVGRVERLVASAAHHTPEAQQRARTLGQIFRSLSTVVVGAAALIHILDVLGWDVRPLLAGAGILGLAVGFGAQTLVRDVIAGFFILAENQFAVGDLIEIDGKAATVEAVSVRSTTLRDFNGYIHFVPNGEMKVVTNRSRGWNRTAIDILVARDQNAERALDICRAVIDAFNAEAQWREHLLDPAEVWGVESIGKDDLQIRVVVKARPGPEGPAALRELRRRLHSALAAAGILGIQGFPQPVLATR